MRFETPWRRVLCAPHYNPILTPHCPCTSPPSSSLPPPLKSNARTHTPPVEEKIAPIPDWTNLVYREILERIIERYELTSMQVG